MPLNRYTHDFCKHRFSIVKRWQKGGEYFAIIRCRWCDLWTRKVITLDQNSRSKSVKLLTQKFLEASDGDDDVAIISTPLEINTNKSDKLADNDLSSEKM